ncbi:hypothetical protein SAY86_014301 [Trapa natans]|uniref:Uncharacterized protein n=1 Tax=Trapa natans TaxID=22666 RepID=A0AAN7KT20_TRANT|nr:hypothetical protein SAY86_014301 [Trapa natans]
MEVRPSSHQMTQRVHSFWITASQSWWFLFRNSMHKTHILSASDGAREAALVFLLAEAEHLILQIVGEFGKMASMTYFTGETLSLKTPLPPTSRTLFLPTG